jgi:hypothetical protein
VLVLHVLRDKQTVLLMNLRIYRGTVTIDDFGRWRFAMDPAVFKKLTVLLPIDVVGLEAVRVAGLCIQAHRNVCMA